MARGDILLYVGRPHHPFERLIMWRTNGPYVHVAVDLGGGLMLDSQLEHGVGEHLVTYDGARIIKVRDYKAQEANIEEGIAWLEERVKEKAGYSFADIMSHIPFFSRLRIFFSEKHAFDCSDLVARYIDKLDCKIDLGKLDDNPELVSPNDIARAAGILR